MANLTQVTEQLSESIYGDNPAGTPDSIRGFVEAITFADADDIRKMLRSVLSADWMALPPWARNLAYRLACLQRGEDAGLLREAAADLLSFGPDWDDVALELNDRANRIDG
jgi:hypothetical protein